ncbi:DivIVA domain-containing protein [Terrabacter sp. 2RAF25]|uniref:DivIVA domain-containing protein n=1 Tax=Terrabacter sp. 2RAF25 TaxID=3232998 RepID=UPI003F9CDF9C
MDPARLVTELTKARFGSTQLRQGYDMAEVDRFIDEVVVALRTGASPAGLASRVRDVRFTTTSLQRGYDIADVDATLESLVTTLEGGVAGADTRRRSTARGQQKPGRPVPDAPRPGLLTRVLGALRGDQPLR